MIETVLILLRFCFKTIVFLELSSNVAIHFGLFIAFVHVVVSGRVFVATADLLEVTVFVVTHFAFIGIVAVNIFLVDLVLGSLAMLSVVRLGLLFESLDQVVDSGNELRLDILRPSSTSLTESAKSDNIQSPFVRVSKLILHSEHLQEDLL